MNKNEWIDRSSLEEFVVLFPDEDFLSFDVQLSRLDSEGIIFVLEKRDNIQSLDFSLTSLLAKKVEGRWLFKRK